MFVEPVDLPVGQSSHSVQGAWTRLIKDGHSDRGGGLELVLERSRTCVAHACHWSAVAAAFTWLARWLKSLQPVDTRTNTRRIPIPHDLLLVGRMALDTLLMLIHSVAYISAISKRSCSASAAERRPILRA